MAQDEGSERVRLLDVERAAEAAGIDPEGLTREERSILRILEDAGRPMGIAAIAQLLGMDEETVVRAHEPYLARRGLLRRTERGRELTMAGKRAFAGDLQEAATARNSRDVLSFVDGLGAAEMEARNSTF